MTTQELVQLTLEKMKEPSVEENAYYMKKYMKNHFEFLGVKSPARKEVQKALRSYWKECSIDEMFDYAESLWRQPFRELQYVAIDALVGKQRKMDASHLPRIESLITAKSWWDTVDGLAPNVAGAIFLRDEKSKHIWVEKWNESDNFWLNRSALLHQLRYKEAVELDLLFSLVDSHSDSKEFFINKASGWALRQASKFYPLEVKQFIDSRPNLSKLTVREGSKYLN